MFSHHEEPNIGNSTIKPIPACALACTKRVFPLFSCSLSDRKCVCDNDNSQGQTLSACIRMQCPLGKQLNARAFQVDYCDFPEHDVLLQLKLMFWICFALASAFTLARFLSRWPRLRGPGFWYDDLVVLMCAGFAAAIVPTTLFQFDYGMGRDVWRLSASELTNFLMWTWIAQLLYIPIVFGTKLSLVLLYMRIWSADNKRLSQSPFRLSCYLLGILEGTYGLVCLLTTLFQCRPLDYNWNFVYPSINGYCVKKLEMYYFSGSMVILFDIVTVFLPLPKLVKLGLPFYTKVGIFFTFLVGFCVTAASLFRIQYLDTIMNSKNITYDIYMLQLWGYLELFLSMICCSMPPVAGLIRRSWGYVKHRGNVPPCTSPTELAKSTISKPYQRVEVQSLDALIEPRRAPIIRISGPRSGVFQPTAPLPPILESESRVGLAM